MLSRRTRARLLARDDSARAADDGGRADRPPARAGSAAEQRRQADAYRALVTAEREAPHLPEVALDAALGA